MPDESHNHVVKANDHDRGRQSEQAIPSLPVESQHAQKDEDSDSDVEILDVRLKQEPIAPDNDAADDQSQSHRSPHNDASLAVDMNVEIPEVKMEVEVSFSRKVPVRYRPPPPFFFFFLGTTLVHPHTQLETRTSAFNTFRKSLHRVFPLDATSAGDTAWSIIGGAPTSMADRYM